MNARLNELENDNEMLKYNSGDQFRECSVLKKSGSDYKIWNGTRIIPTQDAIIYVNFLYDFKYMVYKTVSCYSDNTGKTFGGFNVMLCDTTKQIGDIQNIRPNGKFIFFPSMKYVIQYAMIYYAWKFKGHTYFHHIDYHLFMKDLFDIYNSFSKVESTETLPCSGRACYNLENITNLHSFRMSKNEEPTPIVVDPKGLLDSIRYTAKHLFIGSILSSYFGKKSTTISSMYYKIDNGIIDTDSTLKYVYKNDDHIHKIIILDTQNALEDTLENTYIRKTFQPYYNPIEILFQNHDKFNCIYYTGSSYRFDFGLFTANNDNNLFLKENGGTPIEQDELYNIISFDLYDSNNSSSKTRTIQNGVFTKFGNCKNGCTHILFDYHDEMDILKIYFKYISGQKDSGINYGTIDNYVIQKIQNIKDYKYFEKLFNDIYNNYIYDYSDETFNYRDN